MRKREDGATHYYEYADWADFVDHAATRESRIDFGPAGPASRRAVTGWQATWYGTGTFDAALKLARVGWPEGETLARAYSLALVDRVSNLIERPEYVYDVEGDGVDIGRYVEGEPECWLRQETRIVHGPGRRLYRIVLNVAALCTVSSDVLRARGATTAALAELLELAGHGVAIELVDVSQAFSAADRAVFRVPLKAADQPMDLSRLIYAMAHESCLRRLAFSIMEAFPAKLAKALEVKGGGSYGKPGPLRADEREHGDIYIDAGTVPSEVWSDPQRAVAWVISTLREQGVSVASK